MKKKQLYIVPFCETEYSPGAEVLCASPGLGESEDIGYEDWVITE